MTEPTLTSVENPAEEGVTKQRERSTIGFPYNHLDDAVKVAKAVHDLGDRCGHDQLAPKLGYKSVDNGAYTLKLAAARHFGLITSSKDGVNLNPLGHQIVDSARETRARATAFLTVPLYKALHEKYKGYPLPPTNIGLEAVLVELGVAPKQKDKARQALQRSAEQAGFYSQGRDRLVAPVETGESPTGIEASTGEDDRSGGGGARGGGGSQLPTLIKGLIEKLPAEGSVWSQDDQKQWLEAATVIFGLVYKVERQALPAPRQNGSDK